MEDKELLTALARAEKAERQLNELIELIKQNSPDLWKSINIGYYGAEVPDIKQIKEIEFLSTGRCSNKISPKNMERFCRWKENFTLDVISFACEVTEIHTGKHNPIYTDKLLQLWKQKQINTKEEAIKYCEEERKKFLSHKRNNKKHP